MKWLNLNLRGDTLQNVNSNIVKMRKGVKKTTLPLLDRSMLLLS